MEKNLKNLFSLQANCFARLKEYQNEFETMRLFFDYQSEKGRELVWDFSLLWLEDLERSENVGFDLEANDRKSKYLRQEGNRLFTAKDDKRNVLGACRVYNDAIYAALDIRSDELTLAFANRAMALQSFGYYQQAYDDCWVALKLNYPKSLRHKVIMRQVFCSIKLKNLEKAEEHLNELLLLLNLRAGLLMELGGSLLKELDLDELKKILELDNLEKADYLKELGLFNQSLGLVKGLNELLVDFFKLKKSADLKNKSNSINQIPLNRHTQEIVETESGRCMQAKSTIQKNELIFTERASAFVAVGDTRRMCHQCGTLNFIPLPCLHCRGRVNYCSLKCHKKHFEIHVYECQAYRMQLFDHVGIAHLALRTILDDGLLTVLDELQLKPDTSTYDVWGKLSENGDIWKSNNIQYAESLRMVTHLNKLSKKQIEWYALVSHLLVVYLKHYSKFFDVLKATNKNINWELLTSSLILRHIGQLMCNGHTLTAIIPQSSSLKTTTDFHLLNEKVWSSPWHLKLGCLHFFSNYDYIAALNLPYLSLCNHSCVQMFQNKFSGRFVSAYALRNIKKDEEITNCYDVDYRKGKRKARRERLQDMYHFDCQCENCLQTEAEDKEYNKFYQYRCDNTQCGKLFISSELEVHTFDSLQNNLLNSKIDTNLSCTFCGYRQTLKWYNEILHLMPSVTETKFRHRLFKLFKDSEQYLVGLNKARCFLAQNMVHECFNMFSTNSLDEKDYCNLIEIIKYILNVTRERSSVNSTEYIIYMTYLWDLMAKQKYKCSKAEMDEMLWALSIISDDLKVIFLNYYNDYINVYFDS